MTYLKEKDVFTVEGVLTPEEAQRIVDAAELRGFENQGSRGPAFGEVHVANALSARLTVPKLEAR